MASGTEVGNNLGLVLRVSWEDILKARRGPSPEKGRGWRPVPDLSRRVKPSWEPIPGSWRRLSSNPPSCAQELGTPSEQLQSRGHLEVSSPRACVNFPCVHVRKTLPPPRTWSSLKPDAPAFLTFPVSFKLAAP